jgi:hypothetical protein
MALYTHKLPSHKENHFSKVDEAMFQCSRNVMRSHFLHPVLRKTRLR